MKNRTVGNFVGSWVVALEDALPLAIWKLASLQHVVDVKSPSGSLTLRRGVYWCCPQMHL